MKVSQAVASRKSVRGFLPKQVAPATIRRVLDGAARARRRAATCSPGISM